MQYRLIVTSVIYKSTAVFHGTLAEIAEKIEEFTRVGEYTFSIFPIK